MRTEHENKNKDVSRMDSPHDSEDARTAPAVAPNAHTPGPWYVERKYESGCTIAIMRDWSKSAVALAVHGPSAWIHREGSGPQTIEANARLIAGAPDLLDALKVILELASDVLSNPKYDGIVSDARYAIAKAEGR